MDPENNYTTHADFAAVCRDITEPQQGTKKLYDIKAQLMDTCFALGLPHYEMMWAKSTNGPRYLVTAAKNGNKIKTHIWDTVTGAQYNDEL